MKNEITAVEGERKSDEMESEKGRMKKEKEERATEGGAYFINKSDRNSTDTAQKHHRHRRPSGSTQHTHTHTSR